MSHNFLMNSKELVLLQHKSTSIKKRFVRMYKNANAGHVGSSLSVAEIITFVRFGWMLESDEIIVSKGHAAAALYSMLAEDGTITEDDIATFYKNGTYLAAHPPVNKIKKVPFATGSLGHGLGLAVGLGLAQKIKKSSKKIFCITSDGEINEGSTWEAAMFMRHHALNNVVWLIDRNQLQGFGRTEDVLSLEPLADKLKAFGFNVLESAGHDFNSLNKAKIAAMNSNLPSVIICHTTKGNGWKDLEDTVDCHYLPLNEIQYSNLLNEIEKPYFSNNNKHS
jgi:transketolase